MKTENKNAITWMVDVDDPKDARLVGGFPNGDKEYIAAWLVDKRNGVRLTSCCGAYSTHMDTDELCCKVCCMPVAVGEGDGVENWGKND
mgnify:FL=1